MMTNFAKGSIIDVSPSREFSSESNSIKSYKKVAILKPKKLY